ncbi:MAG: hypothetical protein IPG70_02030 [Moraxellaceae bacterium]|nr:hypothetical protein [Moraxellaceae bacterium]
MQASDLLQGFSDVDSPSLSVVNLRSSSGFLQDNARWHVYLNAQQRF